MHIITFMGQLYLNNPNMKLKVDAVIGKIKVYVHFNKDIARVYISDELHITCLFVK